MFAEYPQWGKSNSTLQMLKNKGNDAKEAKLNARHRRQITAKKTKQNKAKQEVRII